MNADRGSVLWGLVFVTVGGAYLLDALDVWVVRATYLLPVLLIVAGLAVAVTALGDAGDRARR